MAWLKANDARRIRDNSRALMRTISAQLLMKCYTVFEQPSAPSRDQVAWLKANDAAARRIRDNSRALMRTISAQLLMKCHTVLALDKERRKEAYQH